MNALYVHYEVNILLTCYLILFFSPFPSEFRPMISHHVTCHMTTVTYLFIVQKKKKRKENQKKSNIKSEKINKRKMLVSKYTITTFVHSTYVQIALIWSFPVQLSL